MAKKYRRSGYGKWLQEDAQRPAEGGIGKWLVEDNGEPIMNMPKDIVAEAIELMKEQERKAASDGVWRGALAIPPGSFIETLTANFRQNSSIAPELSVMAAFAYFSSFLCKNQIRLQYQGIMEWPTLWLAILAGSGAGKTFVLDYIEEILGGGVDVIEGTEVPTAKAFVEKLIEKSNALFIVDEMGPFFANAKEQGFLAELPSYLLHIYTHKNIERRGGKDGGNIVVENPVLNIIGYSAMASFFEDFDPKHFLTGLAQRFAWVMVEKDPKPTANWKVRKPHVAQEMKERWEKATGAVVPGTIYTIPDDGKAERAFETAYTLLNPKEEIPDSFFRRMMHGCAKRYALIYHILLGKADCLEIDEEDIAWGTRLAYIHATDTKKILAQANLGRLGGLLKKTEELAQRIKDAEGRKITPRDVVRTLNAVKTTAEAKSLIAMLEGGRE